MNKTKIEWADYDKGWLTALIDGEGFLSLYKEPRPAFRAKFTFKPRVGISGKCLRVIERARSLIGAGNICRARSGVYNLDVSANGIRQILSQIKLIEKEQQQDLLQQALAILGRKCGRGLKPRTDQEIEILERIAAEIKRLNKA